MLHGIAAPPGKIISKRENRINLYWIDVHMETEKDINMD
jgi:hypothetical protein